jgi:hypothetical protein
LHSLLLLSLSLLLIFLPACTSLPTTTPPPTPQALLIHRPLALQGWDQRLYACGESFPGLAIFIVDQPPVSSPTGSLYLELHLGASNLSAVSAAEPFVLASEELRLAANIAFPVAELTLPQLRSIFNGQISSSQALDPAAQEFPLQAWTYPSGDEARLAFEKAALLQPAQALIAPDPRLMLEALAGQAGAVGYLPASAFNLGNEIQRAQIKELALKEAPADLFRQPVIFILPAQASDLLNAYLGCLP